MDYPHNQIKKYEPYKAYKAFRKTMNFYLVCPYMPRMVKTKHEDASGR